MRITHHPRCQAEARMLAHALGFTEEKARELASMDAYSVWRTAAGGMVGLWTAW